MMLKIHSISIFLPSYFHKELKNLWSKIYLMHAKWESRLDLEKMTDTQLKDIGLSRYEIEKERNKFF